MKKITLLFTLLVSLFAMHAQLPTGSVAPDFTATDLNGVEYNLYSYLNNEKTVILDFSGTACGPCWKYHDKEHLQDLYHAFGPEGSDELMIFHIEDYQYPGQYNLVVDKLHGIPYKTEFGNWVEGTPFPILLTMDIQNTYNLTYYPLIYMVCPNDNTLTMLGQSTALNIKNTINYVCGDLAGVQNYARAVETSNGFCNTHGNFEAKFKNYGSNFITSAVLNLKKNGTVVATKNYTGDMNPFYSETVTFDEIIVDPLSTYSFEIAEVNGSPNFNPSFSEASLPFHLAEATGTSLHIKIHTYECPRNMRWKILNSSYIEVVSGGPYDGWGNSSCGGVNSNAVIETDVTIPVNDCYTLMLQDTNGYGWKSYYWGTPDEVTPGIEIYSDDAIVYSNLNVGNFGSLLTVPNFLSTYVLDNEVTKSNIFTIYPNPSNGLLNFKTDKRIAINIYNLLGQEIFSHKDVDNNSQINFSGFGDGVYTVKVTTQDNHHYTEKIILKH